MSVQMKTTVVIEDRDPERIEIQRRWRKGTIPILTDKYRAWYVRANDDLIEWSWQRTGYVLKLDGMPRADKRRESVEVDASDVPDYAKVELNNVIRERVSTARAQIAAVQRAAERQVP